MGMLAVTMNEEIVDLRYEYGPGGPSNTYANFAYGDNGYITKSEAMAAAREAVEQLRREKAAYGEK